MTKKTKERRFNIKVHKITKLSKDNEFITANTYCKVMHYKVSNDILLISMEFENGDSIIISNYDKIEIEVVK